MARAQLAGTRRLSGDVIISKVSGETIVGKVSRETLALASGTGPISVSGQPIRVSGETLALASGTGPILAKVSGEVVTISGQVVDLKTPTTIKTSGLFVVTAGSGGANLPSGGIVSVTVKGLSTNSGNIFVGGSTHLPYSGFGFLLEAGEAVNLDVGNFGEVWLCATVSGDKATYLGIT